jgi:hypothetical protein
VRQATLTLYRADVSTAAHAFYAAENPAEGATFTYHLAQPAERVQFTVTNAAGAVVRTFTAPGRAGTVQRAQWDLRWAPVAGGGFGGGFTGGEDAPPAGAGGMTRAAPSVARRPALPVPAHDIGARGFHVAPGRFTVTMVAGRDTVRQEFDVRGDPASDITVAEHQAREAFLREVVATQSALTTRTTQFRAALQAATGGEAEALQATARTLGLGAAEPGGRGGRGVGGPGAALGQLISAYTGSGVRQTSFRAPTGTQRAALDEAKQALARLEAALGESR